MAYNVVQVSHAAQNFLFTIFIDLIYIRVSQTIVLSSQNKQGYKALAPERR